MASSRAALGAALLLSILALAACGTKPAAAAHHVKQPPKSSSSGGTYSYGYGSSGSGQGSSTSVSLSAKLLTSSHTIALVAGDGSANNGFNFDGGYQGSITVTVPVGWSLTVNLKNDGSLPHSAVVTASVKDIAPVFAGAETQRPTQGVPPGGSAQFHFVASKAGSYYVACAVPGHAEDHGMWIRFDVSQGVSLPTVSASGQ